MTLGARLRRHRAADVRERPARADPARGPGGGDAAGHRAAGRQPRLHREQAARDRGPHRAAARLGRGGRALLDRRASSGDNSRLHDLHPRALGRARPRPAGDRRRRQPGRRRGGRRAQPSPMQPNSLGIRGAGQGLQFAILGSDFDTLGQRRRRAGQEDGGRPGFGQVRLSYETTQPQLFIKVDRERASDLGIDIDGLGETLQSVLDGTLGRLGLRRRPQLRHQAHLDDEPGARPDRPREPVPADPLGRDGADVDRRHPRGARRSRPSSTARARCARSRSPPASTTAWRSATPTREAQALAAPLLPPGARLVPLAETATLGETSNGLLVTFGFAILVVFLVLAAQFESFVSALIVMATVPLGLGCAMVAMVLTGRQPQRLQPDRPRAPGRDHRQERHPRRRVRQPAPRPRRQRARGDRGGLPHPAPAGDDDDGRDDPRRRAAAALLAAPAPRRARRSAG